jgi:heat-inducible transcriptional repressor
MMPVDVPESDEITPRSQTVLRLVVGEYIKTATPVGSKLIGETYDLGISPATIRHEMAELEDKGYLTHPHTSAGRVPTEKGYRYFVEKLMGEGNLTLAERRTISHQFHQARLDVDQWMRLAAAVVAHKAQGAALVTAPHWSTCRLKHVELISIRDSVVLLILVLQAGIVKQQVLTLSAPATQEDLSRSARQLTHHWSGLDEVGITCAADASEMERRAADAVRDMMRRIDVCASADIYRDGLWNVLGQPEFMHSEGAQQVLRLLEERQFVDTLVSDVIRHGGLQIIIGGEGRWQDLSEVSVVLARYGVEDEASGALGVLGPLRMQYDRAVSVVRFVSQLMSDLMSDLYGQRS